MLLREYTQEARMSGTGDTNHGEPSTDGSEPGSDAGTDPAGSDKTDTGAPGMPGGETGGDIGGDEESGGGPG
jgi:hypothetical protein